MAFFMLLLLQQIHIFLPFGLWNFQHRHSLLDRHTHVLLLRLHITDTSLSIVCVI